MKKDKLNFFQPQEEKNLGQWLMEQGISAGFPVSYTHLTLPTKCGV